MKVIKEIKKIGETLDENIAEEQTNAKELGEFFFWLINQEKTVSDYTEEKEVAMQLRGCIIEWVYCINRKLKGTNETFFKAINILDHFLEASKRNDFDQRQMQLYAAVCYYIAFKFEEVSLFNLAFLESGVLHRKYTTDEITKAEFEVLKTLKFKINYPTIEKYSNIFMEKIKNYLNKHRLFDTFQNVNYFVNLISLLVEELIVGIPPSKIALINFKTTLLFLYKNRIVTGRQIDKILALLETEYDVYDKDEINTLSESLFQATSYQEKSSKNTFFQIYTEAITKAK